jgi:uncharacterized protein (TIGR03086 family)
MDVLDLFERGTAWTQEKVAGAADQLDTQTNCEEWTVRRMIDHLLAGLEMFAGATEGGHVAPPDGPPPELVHAADPGAQYEHDRKKVAMLYAEPGVLQSMMNGSDGQQMHAAQVLGIAFCDHLIHGWDIATSTGQDATIPDDLAQAAFAMLDGNIQDASRGPGKIFKEAVAVPDAASVQDKLVAYCGRHPA